MEEYSRLETMTVVEMGEEKQFQMGYYFSEQYSNLTWVDGISSRTDRKSR